MCQNVGACRLFDFDNCIKKPVPKCIKDPGPYDYQVLVPGVRVGLLWQFFVTWLSQLIDVQNLR